MKTTREITTEECFWLDEPIPVGTEVELYEGTTYGVIGEGIAVVIPSRHATQFTEIPRDAI